MPAVVSFTVETDGRLPTGQPLGDAIGEIDRESGSFPLYYMINCAHPTHFEDTLASGGDWVTRIGGLRANSSCKGHAEPDGSSELDTRDPDELGGGLRLHVRELGGVGRVRAGDDQHVGGRLGRETAERQGGRRLVDDVRRDAPGDRRATSSMIDDRSRLSQTVTRSAI